MQGKRHHYKTTTKRPSYYAKRTSASMSVLENEILPFYREGFSIPDISDLTMIRIHEINSAIKEQIERNLSIRRKSVNPVYVQAIESFVNNPDLGASAGYEFGISQPAMGKIIERYFGFRRSEETEVISLMSKI